MPRGWWALLLALSCARQTEVIGHVEDGAAPDAGAEASALVCAPDPPVSPASTGAFNCGPRCFKDDAVADLTFDLTVDAADASRPLIAYPLAGALVPLNFADLAVHWRRGTGAGQQAFRLRLTAAADLTRRYELFIPCGAPEIIADPHAQEECAYTLPSPVLAAIAAENAGQTLSLTIEGRDAARGTISVASPAVALGFSSAAIGGGAYYFSNAARTLWRGTLGGGAQAFISPNQGALARFGCAGCHAVSRDGQVVAFGAEQSGHLMVSRADDPDRPSVSPPTPAVDDAATMSVSPDGQLVLVSHGAGRLTVRRAAGGATVAELDPAVLGTPERQVYFPDWSADGQAIVATLATVADAPWSVGDGAIAVIPYNGGRFGAATVMVPRDDRDLNFYPSFSPDGQWILFASAPLPGPSYNNRNTRLRLVGRGGGPPHELARATGAIGKTTSYPRFLPSAQAGCSVFFFTMSSRLDYGLVLENTIIANGGWSQLWLAAIDVRQLAGDPSSAPLWLPFQDVRSPNLQPVWTNHLVCGAASPCGPRTTCQSGECRP